MDFSILLGWLLANVAVPILAPIAFFPLLSVGTKYRGRVRELVMRSVQGGQLFWTVIALCAAASYKAAVYMSRLEGADISIGRMIAWTAIAWHIAIIVISAVLIVLGAMEAADEEDRAATLQAPQGVAHVPQIMVVSVWLSIATAVSVTATHLWAS